MPPQLSITEGLGSAISTNILLGIAIAAVASLLISLVPLLQKTQGLCALCIIAAAAFYRQAFTGFGMVILAAYLVMRWLNHGTPGSRRWHWACISLLFLVGIFTLGRVLH